MLPFSPNTFVWRRFLGLADIDMGTKAITSNKSNVLLSQAVYFMKYLLTNHGKGNRIVILINTGAFYRVYVKEKRHWPSRAMDPFGE